MIIAVDFDGTLVKHNYPEIGEPIYKVIGYVKKMKREGAQLILWTCREGEELEEAVDWCNSVGIEFDAINENVEELKYYTHLGKHKIIADIYLDDKALNTNNINKEYQENIKRVIEDEIKELDEKIDNGIFDHAKSFIAKRCGLMWLKQNLDFKNIEPQIINMVNKEFWNLL